MSQLWIAMSPRARPMSKKVTTLFCPRDSKGPTNRTRYLPSVPWDLRIFMNVEPGNFISRSAMRPWARFSCQIIVDIVPRVSRVPTPKYLFKTSIPERQNLDFIRTSMCKCILSHRLNDKVLYVDARVSEVPNQSRVICGAIGPKVSQYILYFIFRLHYTTFRHARIRRFTSDSIIP